MSTQPIDDGLEAIRATVRRQRLDQAPTRDWDLSALPRFAPDLPERLDPRRRAEIVAAAAELEPWLQGPFYVGGDLVLGGAWRNDERWVGIGEIVGDLSGRRVLDIGSNAGYDPFMFRLHGAEYVLGCEPYAFIRQARLLEEIYRTGVDMREIRWQSLDPAEHGSFDLVHCHGVLYHERDPLSLLRRLREMLGDGGRLLLGSMMLARPDVSEHVRFVPDAFGGDETWWWVPGRLALRWMLEASGFAEIEDLGVHPGPPGEFPVVNGYLAAVGA